MKINNKRQVRAQRKFAQGAYVPPSTTNNNTPVRADLFTQPAPKDTNIIYNNLSAKNLLDIVSFQKTHLHQPVVVLERLAASSTSETPPPNDLQKTIIKPEKAKTRVKTRVFSSLKAIKPRKTLVRICTSLTSSNKGIVKSNATKTSENTMCLRSKNRIICKKTRRNSILTKICQNGVKKNNILKPLRKRRLRSMVSSSDDETPLQFLKKKKSVDSKTSPRRSNELKAKNSDDVAPSKLVAALPIKASHSPKQPSFPQPICMLETINVEDYDVMVDEHTSNSKVAKKLTNRDEVTGPKQAPTNDRMPQYYGRHRINKWLDSANVSKTVATNACRSEIYVRMQAKIGPHLSTEVLCKNCDNCRRLEKMVKISALLQIPYFPQESHLTASVNGGDTSKSLPANNSDDNIRNIYLDLLPPDNNQVIHLTLTNTPNKKKSFMRTRFVAKSAANFAQNISLVEHEDILDQLLLTLTMSDAENSAENTGVTDKVNDHHPATSNDIRELRSRPVESIQEVRKPLRNTGPKTVVEESNNAIIPLVENKTINEDEELSPPREVLPSLRHTRSKSVAVEEANKAIIPLVENKTINEDEQLSPPRKVLSSLRRTRSNSVAVEFTKNAMSNDMRNDSKNDEQPSSKSTIELANNTISDSNQARNKEIAECPLSKSMVSTAMESANNNKSPNLEVKTWNMLPQPDITLEPQFSSDSEDFHLHYDDDPNDETAVTATEEEPPNSKEAKDGTSGTLKDDEIISLLEENTIEAPTFHLTEAEFSQSDPISFYEKIKLTASKYGICKIVAPKNFQPKCVLNDKMKFQVMNQYVGRMYNRWGPAAREMSAIKAYLSTQKVVFHRPPLMEGLELDLVKLYYLVKRHGGQNVVVEKTRWGRIVEEMKCTGANAEKMLDRLFVRYLMPYATLSHAERQNILAAVERGWNKKNRKLLDWALNPLHRQKKLLCESESSSDEEEEERKEVVDALVEAEDCVVQGRLMNLANFKKVAVRAMALYCSESPQNDEAVETMFWRLVVLGGEHVSVNTASIDTSKNEYGFSKNRTTDSFSRNPWNLKMLSKNSGNVLRSLGAVIGVTVPTLHLGMVFSTSSWHRDPHGLPWMEYLHSGPSKIWYGIPDEQSDNFRKAVETLCPTSCQNKGIWLPSDITMIPPNLLREHCVRLCRVVQNPGEFIIVFPKAYSCSISTGLTVSESVYFATNSYLNTVQQVFQELRESCEPTSFALEQLLVALARDRSVPLAVLQQVYASLTSVIAEELKNRSALGARGLTVTLTDKSGRRGAGRARVASGRAGSAPEFDECEVCRTTLYLSKVSELTGKRSSVCLRHALRLLENPKYLDHDLSKYELVIYYSDKDLNDFTRDLRNQLRNNKS